MTAQGNKTYLFILRMAIAVAVVILYGCVADSADEPRSLVGVGDRLPLFSVVADDGSVIDNGSLAGGWSVIVFFNTECGDCRRELPVVEEFHRLRPDVRVICISRSESEGQIAGYWAANSLTLPYSAQEDDTVYRLFATGGIPRIYVSDPSLTIKAMWSDSPAPTLEDLLDSL